jgi:FG-GAP-like repeat/Abnormal spindle-like microcephaly-assoc'd, ASPM-SPD-2-Hydin
VWVAERARNSGGIILVKGNRITPAIAAVGLAFLSLAVPRASAQNYLFNEAGFTTGTSPEALASADFNGDGQPDLAVVDHGAATVSVLLGLSNGTFAPKVDYAVGDDPDSVVAADFNNDGKMDLAVVSSSGNSVSLLIGVGNGTFTVSGTLATGNNPDSIAAGDFNGDGNIDLAVSNFNDSTVSIFLGNGDGTFGAGTTYSTGASTSPESVAVGDFNKDGKLDLATADGAANSVSILLGNGDGTFQASVEYSCGLKPLQVIVDDFNNDGDPDLAVVDGGEPDVVVMLGNGKGTYQSQEHIATVKVPQKLVSGDFNGDGDEDIAYTSTAGNFVVVLVGTGTGTFNVAPNIGQMYATGISGGSPDAIIANDFNGDGRQDLAIVNPADNDVTIMLGNGDADCTFSSSTPSSPVETGPVTVATGDFNGDGKLDAAVVSATEGTVSILLGSGNGTFQTPVSYSLGTTPNPQGIAVGNLNNDACPDLAVVDEGTNTVSVLLNVCNGTGAFAPAVPYMVGNFPLSVAIADYNGDGLPDLAVANSGDDTVSILLNTGNGVFGTAKTYAAGEYPTSVVAANVFNHSNGILDLAVANKVGNAISVLEGNGDGSFQTNVPYSAATTSVTNPGPVAVTVADFNGDGLLDLAAADSSSNTVSILLNNASNPGTFGTATTFPTGVTPVSIASGDLNGDGIIDLAAGNSSATIDSVSTLFGNGDGTFQTHLEHATGFNPANGAIAEGIALADFTGMGGPLDLAAVDYSFNTLSVFLNAPVVAISPATLAFPGTLVGTTSAPLTVTISNPGSAPLPFTSAAITVGTFGATTTCPSTIAVGGTCTASVTFAPTTGGAATGTLTINDGASTSPQAVALSGTGTAPTVGLSPTTLTFTTQTVGTTSAAQTVTLSNTGTGPLDITSITASAQFGETNTCGSSVAAGATCTVSVTFSPTAPGIQTGTLTFTDNASNSPQTVSLTGTGSGPAVSLTPATLTFSAQPVNTTSTAQTITLKNTGTQTLTITSVTASGPYAVTNTCGGSIGAGASCALNVTFTPTATGTETGTVTVTDNAIGSPQTVALTGTGSTAPLVTLAPTSISFPTTAVGSPSTAQVVTLTNSGNASVSITSITFTGADPGDFSQTNTCGTSVLAGKTCTISVVFTPAATGNRSATLSVADSAAGSPQTVAVSGTGSSEAGATLSPTSLDFGGVSVGANISKTVTLTNSGNATLTVSAITISGSSTFTESTTGTASCTSTTGVAPGKTCTITVTFAPTAFGNLSATLDVADNAAGSPQVVTLSGSGSGPTASLAPTSLAFGGQSLNSAGAAKSVTLTNSGNTALAISKVAVTGSAASQFVPTNACGASVAAGASCTISVVFTPTSTGNQSASLAITDDAPGSPQTVSLSGAGNGFSLSASTPSVTVPAGSSATYNLSISGLGAFSGTVSLSCSDSVAATSCAVFPSSISVTAPNSTAATVTVTTTAGGLPPQSPRTPAPPRPWLWLGIAGSLALGIRLLTGRLTGSRRRPAWALAGALAMVLAWAACGGGSSSPSTPVATPAGTYTVTVSGNSNGVSANTTLTIIVQ